MRHLFSFFGMPPLERRARRYLFHFPSCSCHFRDFPLLHEQSKHLLSWYLLYIHKDLTITYTNIITLQCIAWKCPCIVLARVSGYVCVPRTGIMCPSGMTATAAVSDNIPSLFILTYRDKFAWYFLSLKSLTSAASHRLLSPSSQYSGGHWSNPLIQAYLIDCYLTAKHVFTRGDGLRIKLKGIQSSCLYKFSMRTCSGIIITNPRCHYRTTIRIHYLVCLNMTPRERRARRYSIYRHIPTPFGIIRYLHEHSEHYLMISAVYIDLTITYQRITTTSGHNTTYNIYT
jgi:hypothetical protein